MANVQACPRVRHLLTGTFNTANLHLLAFDTLTHTLAITRSVSAQGPHQFLALGASTPIGQPSLEVRPQWKAVYATTWAQPPSLSAWAVTGLDEDAGASIEMATKVNLDWLSTVNITATSSYVHTQPPPYESFTAPSYGVSPGSAQYLYSAGGPTGEIHHINPQTGALDAKQQERIFLRDNSEEALGKADKTRKALRYGAHNIDISVDQLALVADLGRNAILTYRRDPADGTLTFLSETTSPRGGDGPRHVVPSPDGRWIYSVTEHTSFVDVFEVTDVSSGTLKYRTSLDILPEGSDRASFRGDTVRLSPSGRAIVATTRGKTPAVRGWVAAWDLVTLQDALPQHDQKTRHDSSDGSPLLTRWRTPTSGGKANAIEWTPRYAALDQITAPSSTLSEKAAQEWGDDWAVLTDDAEGHVLILKWDGRDLVEVARTKLPGKGVPELGEGEEEGASHAIWLS
ncbi:unnamed protein product [Tilletia controversa]|uniref:Muconate cycloisomerase 1 n=1 Tax=Tilletia controversa TaxID=13291 RepID=A0A8X7MPZ2_9BASI|nr:hypothetical protein A4X06_0g6076 [Tilletia controversa]CAD6923158.1 unnamed protein product [Tilletia controversa]CAD6964045.1 unnamed protein product [Tilletia controversa]